MNAVYNALGLFASALKSGEPWTNDCQLALEDAKTALLENRVMLALVFKALDDECPELPVTAALRDYLRNTG